MREIPEGAELYGNEEFDWLIGYADGWTGRGIPSLASTIYHSGYAEGMDDRKAGYDPLVSNDATPWMGQQGVVITGLRTNSVASSVVTKYLYVEGKIVFDPPRGVSWYERSSGNAPTWISLYRE